MDQGERCVNKNSKGGGITVIANDHQEREIMNFTSDEGVASNYWRGVNYS